MPDFRVTAQAPFVGPDPSEAYDRGLGGATGSTFAAGVDGLVKGLSFGADITAKILQTRRDNDPAKIAADQLALDLKNQTTEQALKDSTFDYGLKEKYGEYDQVTQIQSRVANTDYTGNLSRQTEVNTALKEAYGAQEIESEIEARRAQAYSALNKAEKSNGAKPLTQAQKAGVMKDLFNVNEKIADRKEPPKDPSDPNQFNRPKAVEDTPEQIRQRQIRDQMEKLLTEEVLDPNGPYETGQVADKFATGDYERARETYKNRVNRTITDTGSNRVQKANDLTAQMEYAAAQQDPLDPESTEPIKGWMSLANEFNELASKFTDEGEVLNTRAALSNSLERMGPEYLEQAAEQLQGQDKENFVKIADKSRALTGNPALLSNDQKSLSAAQLPKKYVENSTLGMSEFASYITKGEKGVSDPEFRDALRGHPYIAAAQLAMRKYPNASFTTQIDYGESGGDGDVSGQGPAMPMFQVMTEEGEVVSQAELKPDTQSNGVANLLTDLYIKRDGELRQQAQTAQALDQTRNGNQRPQQGLPPAQTLPPAAEAPVDEAPAAAAEAPYGAPQAQPTATPAPALEPTAEPAPEPTPTPQLETQVTPAPDFVDTNDPTKPGPLDTGTPIWEGKPYDHVYGIDEYPQEGPNGLRAYKKETPTGIWVINNQADLSIPEVYTGDPPKLTGAQIDKMKPIQKVASGMLAKAKSSKATIAKTESLVSRAEANNLQYLFGEGGAVPRLAEKTKANIAGTVGLQSDENKLAVEIIDEQQRVISQAIKDFMEPGGRSTAANTATEQQTIARATFSTNTELENLRAFNILEQARIARDEDVAAFISKAASYPTLNEPGNIDSFVGKYFASPYSAKVHINPERFPRVNGKLQEDRAKRDRPMYVENNDPDSATPYLTMSEFMLLPDQDTRPAAPAARPTATATAQPTPTPFPPVAPQATQKPTSFQGDATIDPQGVNPDTIISPVDYREADVVGGGPDFLADAGQAPAAQNTTDVGLPDLVGMNPYERAGLAVPEGEEAAPDPNAPILVNGREEKIGPPSTYFEGRGNTFASEEEAQYYRQAVEDVRNAGTTTLKSPLPLGIPDIEINPTMFKAWVKDLVSLNSREQADTNSDTANRDFSRGIDTLFGKGTADKIGLADPTVSDRAIELKNAAVTEALNRVGGQSTLLGSAKYLSELGVTILQDIGVTKGLGGLKTVQKLGRAATKIGSNTKVGATVVATAASDTALQKVRQSNPTDPIKPLDVFSPEGWKNFAPDFALNAGGQLVLGALAHKVSPFFRGFKNMGAPDDAKALARASVEAGAGREQLEAMSAGYQPGKSILRDAPPEIKTIGERLGGTAETRPFATAKAAERERIYQAETQENIQSAFAGAPTLAEVKRDFGDAVTSEMDRVRSVAATEAENKLTAKIGEITDDFATTNRIDSEGSLRDFDNFFRRDFMPSFYTDDGVARPVAEAVEAVVGGARRSATDLKDAANMMYPALRETALSDDLAEGLTTRLRALNSPRATELIESVRSLSTRPPEKGMVGNLHFLDEMRREAQALGKGGPGRDVYTRMANEIESTINQQLAREQLGSKAYSQFLGNQAGARQLSDKLGERADYAEQIQVALDKSQGSRAARDKILKTPAKLQETFGRKWASRLEKQLRDTDATTKVYDDLVSGKIISTDKELADGLKAAQRLGNGDNYIKALVTSESDAAARVAKSVGFSGKEDFNDGVLAYLQKNFKNSIAKMEAQGGPGGSGTQGPQTAYKMLGLAEQSQVDNALSMLTPKNRDLVTAAIEAQQKIDQGRYFFSSPPTGTSLTSGRLKNPALKILINSLGTALDVVYSRLGNSLTLKEQQALVKALADNDPVKLKELVDRAIVYMKPTARGTGLYGDYINYESARQISRALMDITEPAGTARIQGQREIERSSSARGLAVEAQPVREPATVAQVLRNRARVQAETPAKRSANAGDVIARRKKALQNGQGQ